MISRKIHNIKNGKINFCQITGKKDLKKVIDLGYQPLCDTLLSKKDILKNVKEKKYPLVIYRSKSLGHSQLNYCVNPKEVFHKNYPYKCGMTREVVHHHKKIADKNIKEFKIKKNQLVLDIGSNDGTLLSAYKKEGMNVVGVEPTNIYKLSKKKNITTYNNFFDEKVAKTILKNHGYPKLITCTNVFAHVAELGTFLKSLKILMNNETIFMFENHYMPNILKNVQFDTFYHEHLKNYSLMSLIMLFSYYDMKLFDARVVERYSGTLQGFVSIKNNIKIKNNVSILIKNEKKIGLLKNSIWKKFTNQTDKIKNKTRKLLLEINENNKTIVGWGCPGRCSTLLNFYKINRNLLPMIVEQPGSFKIGKFLPGVRIPIVNNNILNKKKVDFILILAWHYSKEIISELKKRKISTKVIIPLPKLKVIKI